MLFSGMTVWMCKNAFGCFVQKSSFFIARKRQIARRKHKAETKGFGRLTVDNFCSCGYNGAKAMIGRVARMQARREGRPRLKATPQRTA